MRRIAVVLLVCCAAVAAVVVQSSFAAAQAPERARTTTNVTVHMTEFSFVLSKTSAPVGTVVFTIVNDGTEPHNFSIAARTSDTIGPGNTTTLKVAFTSAGAQPYVCTLTGHAAAGMQGTFTITGSTGTKQPTAILNATEKEWKISLTTSAGAKVTAVKAGVIRFKVRNTGRTAHNFVIAGHQTKLLARGRRAVLDVLLRKGRRYTYLCSVKGHAKLGMTGVLVVR
jgi:plastocyanin